MIIRQSTPGEPGITLEPISGDAAAALATAFADIDPWRRYPYPAGQIETYLTTLEAGAPRFVIRLGTDIAGAVGIREMWLRGPYLQFLGVLPLYQRHGLGRVILAWFESTARRDDSRNLWVATSDFNTEAIRFYERFGFKRVVQLDDLVRDGKTEILLRKKLRY
jgi:diamine N-acetyltransferase